MQGFYEVLGAYAQGHGLGVLVEARGVESVLYQADHELKRLLVEAEHCPVAASFSVALLDWVAVDGGWERLIRDLAQPEIQ